MLYAVGAPTDRRLGIAGEDLPGSHAATEFVAWYNGHPDAADRTFDLGVRRAVVIGNGNVALDVARMLALTPEELAPTDTADHAIDALAASGIEEIVVARPARARAGGVHEPGAARARRSWTGADVDRGSRRGRARPAQPRTSSSPARPTRPRGATWRS